MSWTPHAGLYRVGNRHDGLAKAAVVNRDSEALPLPVKLSL
tara:strand:+ start:67 stop:189 length:123 start_codon:yes stop_codon:yes gene_type:complete